MNSKGKSIISIQAKVRRKDGTVEDLGEIYNKDKQHGNSTNKRR